MTLEKVESVSCPDCWSGPDTTCVPIGGQEIVEMDDMERMYHKSRLRRAEKEESQDSS